MRLVAIAVLTVLFGQCASTDETSVEQPKAISPKRPPKCKEVKPGQNLQKIIDHADEGTALCLQPGHYSGSLQLNKPIVLWGEDTSIIKSQGQGTTVLIKADGCELLGLTIDGSGARFDTLDAAVHVQADNVRVEGIRIRNATFGILVEKAERARVLGNHVLGNKNAALGLRGDGIRLWEVYDSLVENNNVEHTRDVVVWYSSRNRFAKNRVVDGRYGTHFMYSHGNTVAGNEYRNNVVGIFVMYSRNITITDSLFLHSSGAAGMGLGIKESGNIKVLKNDFLDNTVGVYLDTSPLQLDDHNFFRKNRFKFGDVAVIFHGGERSNTFRNNAFVGYQSPVRVEGGGNALSTKWIGNVFDDYAGYDLDDDGVGDIPYELRSLSNQIVSTYPQLSFFFSTLSLAILDFVGRAVPLLEPKLILVDPKPRLKFSF